MKAKSKLFLSFLQYDWWKIVGVVLLSAAVLGYGFNAKDKIKEEETLEIFVTGSSKDLSFQQDLYKKVEGSSILAVHCSCYSSSDSQYNLLASTNISGISDLFLLPESVLSTHKEYFTYAKAGEGDSFDSIKKLPVTFYEGELGSNKGIKVYDKDDASYNEGKSFSSWFTFEETTYLFVSSESTNANSKGTNGGDLLWECAYYFLSLGIQ